jgi:hypothetical protein
MNLYHFNAMARKKETKEQALHGMLVQVETIVMGIIAARWQVDIEKVSTAPFEHYMLADTYIGWSDLYIIAMNESITFSIWLAYYDYAYDSALKGGRPVNLLNYLKIFGKDCKHGNNSRFLYRINTN